MSRIDLLVDPLLERVMDKAANHAETAGSLRGQVAIASAKVAYSFYKKIFKSDRFRTLALKGAVPQRVLWASTSAKSPDYSPVKYVGPLIGPATINTMPPETINAYRSEGNPDSRLEEGVTKALAVLRRLSEFDIDIDRITQQLEDGGVEKFNRPFDSLLTTLDGKRLAVLAGS